MDNETKNKNVQFGNASGYITSKQARFYFPEYPSGGKHSPGASNTRHFLADHNCRWLRFGQGNIHGKQLWLKGDVLKIAENKHAKHSDAKPAKQTEIKFSEQSRIDKLEKIVSQMQLAIEAAIGK